MKNRIKTLRFVLKKTHQLMPSYLVMQALSAVLQTALTFIVVYLPSIALNAITESSTVINALSAVFLYLAIIFGIQILLSMIRKDLLIKTQMLNNIITAEVSEQLLDVSFERIEKPGFTDVISNAVSPITNLGVIYNLFESIPRIIQFTFTILGATLIIAQFNVAFIGLILLISCLQFLVNRVGIQKETEYAKRSFGDNKHYWYYLRIFRDPVLAKDIRIYHMQPFLLKKEKEVFNRFVQGGSKEYQIRDIRDLIGRLCSNILIVTVYFILLSHSISQSISPASLILIVNAATSLFMALTMIQTDLLSMNQSLIYLESYNTLHEEIVSDLPTGTIILNEPIQTIEFRNVTFRYPESTQNILKSLNITIHAPTTVSIVGRNGCGKTTMMKLLSRLYKPTYGEILVNGINIQDYELHSYLDQLAIIFQDFKIFQTTVEDNITFGKANPELLKTAIEQPGLDLELLKFPNAEQTVIGKDFDDNGIQISKGQEQKIAIARSIFKNGSLMILDEPTASLDPIAEEDVYNHFSTITKKRLSIMISHRLSSCKNSNTILFLEDGTVKEAGSHQALMEQNGGYAYMFNLQKMHYHDTETERTL